ncbi:MAG TPA: hypothetical protein VJY54_05085 [Lachnospiraceae bacterium]|nr:hypothetical protein [Lachnospiraceae bacterium]
MDRKEERVVDGYLFLSTEDAKLAEQEKIKIEYLEQHMNYITAQNVLEVYKKANTGRMFVTPVGYSYLRKIQEYLLQSEDIDSDQVPILELYSSYAPQMRKSYTPARQYVKPSRQKKPQWPLFSVIANIILALAVASMFGIAIKSDNPNILNYETVLTNKYASWEQEITQREAAIREKEKQLQISVD